MASGIGQHRKICVVTGTRAEYGLLYWLMKEIQADEELILQIVVTGMHLSPEFGLTYKVIESDGFAFDAKVEMLLSSDTPVGITKSIGLGVIGFADALDRLKPDIMVVLGDRYEILAAVQAALFAKIPVAHLSGGEKTEGAIDESIRHAITKMSHYHFVAAEEYRQRVIQMGENPERVFNFGDPGVDNIGKLPLLSIQELEESINFKLGKLNFLVTYHPVTLSKINPVESMQCLLDALDNFPDAKAIITKPNADAGGRIIAQMIDEYTGNNSTRVYSCVSLGQVRYLSAMKYCDVVIGNSSSGIVEAPAMKRATVDIGIRQQGRLKATSIIECGENAGEITSAITKALSNEFKQSLQNVASLYGTVGASYKIKDFLKKCSVDTVILKQFYDLHR
jgi:UDP-N-acetylglucosamine 2-epimerase (non-hydrolysing)/GDP/UDP-N,N'-diacetylbacillosamine 2-epimerase (hydrolysing)